MQNRKTKQSETDETKKTRKWVPPRGIRLFAIPNRPENPFGVQWRVDGKAKTKTFATKEAQVEFAKSLAGDVREVGVAAFRLDESEARECVCSG